MVPHRSKMSNHETAPILDDIYEHTIHESEGQIEEAEDEIVLQPQQQQQHSQRRMGYLDLHPECRPLHLNQCEGEDIHELDICAPVEDEVEPPRRSDVSTESVYSSSGNNHSPPASPKTAAVPDPAPAASVGDNSPPPQVTAATTLQHTEPADANPDTDTDTDVFAAGPAMTAGGAGPAVGETGCESRSAD